MSRKPEEFPKCAVLPWTPLCPRVWGAQMFQGVPSIWAAEGRSGDLPLLLWVARGKNREFMDRSKPLQAGMEMQKWRSFLQTPCARPGSATGPWAAGWGTERAFFSASVCISGGIKPISLLLVVLEHNSTCLNVDRFRIYSGAGEKREKIMHRVGGSWEEPPFSSFLPQFSMRNHVDSSFQPANANWDKLGGRLTNYCNVMVAVLQFSLQKAFNSQLSSSQLPFNW